TDRTWPLRRSREAPFSPPRCRGDPRVQSSNRRKHDSSRLANRVCWKHSARHFSDHREFLWQSWKRPCGFTRRLCRGSARLGCDYAVGPGGTRGGNAALPQVDFSFVYQTTKSRTKEVDYDFHPLRLSSTAPRTPQRGQLNPQAPPPCTRGSRSADLTLLW